MRKFGQRSLSLAILAVAFSCAALAERSAAAQTSNWEYLPALGGYLDWDTGLVWGEEKGISTWDGAVAHCSALAITTGFPWRLPTVSEAQEAAADGIFGANPSISFARSNWTSDAKTKGGAKTAHYVIQFGTGGTALFGNGSLIDSTPVYRAFTP